MNRTALFTKVFLASAIAASLAWPQRSDAAIIVKYETLTAGSSFNFSTIDDPSNADGGQSATVAQHPNSSISATAGFNNYATLHDGVTGPSNTASGNGILHSSTTNDLLYYYDLGSTQNIRQINAYSFNTNVRDPVTLSIWGSNHPNAILAGGAAGTSSGATTITALKNNGWIEIVGVGSPSAGTASNRESGAEISDSTGSLGQYRYLLFSHSPNNFGSNSSSYIREIDVYTGGAKVGVDIAINNASFETGIVQGAPGGTGSVSGWTVSGGTLVFSEGFGSATNLPPSEGINSVALRSNPPAGPVVLEQTLSTLTEMGEYTLSFFVADRSNAKWLNYEVDLLSGTDVLISEDSASNSALRPFNASSNFLSDVAFGAEGDWLNVMLSGVATADMIGQPLTIRFTSTARSNDPDATHNDFALDNIQLSFVAAVVPEPSSIALWMLLGVVGLAFGAWRRRQNGRSL